MSYISKLYAFEITTSASTNAFSIPVEEYDKFSLSYFNLTSAALLDLDVEVANGAWSAGNVNYVSANTAIIPVPSALGASAIVTTSAIENAWKYLRVTVKHSATAGTLTSAGTKNFKVIVGGHRRR